MSEDMMDQLAATLDNRELTDESGEIPEEGETFEDDTAASETTTPEEDSDTGENPEDDFDSDTQSDDDDSESNLAEDESGKRYVPEKRFKGVYSKMKEYERALKEREELAAQGEQLLQQSQKSKSRPKGSAEVKVDKADILELKMTLPQFNPANEEYDPTLDTMGLQILKANPGITPLEAGKAAIEMAKKISSSRVQAKTEARNAKAQQSDQGITTRVKSRQATQPNVDQMSDLEIEDMLRQSGQW
jgi:hypothetical protein